MDNTEALLLFINRNTRAGVSQLSAALNIAKDGGELHSVLSGQRKGYVNLHSDTEAALRARHLQEEDMPEIPKMWAQIELHLHTAADKSDAKLAEVMAEATAAGIIEIQQHINEFSPADEDVAELANTLLRFQEGAFAKFKEFV